MNTFLKNLFDYNHRCNQALIRTMLDYENILSAKSLSLFSHILNAQHIWNCKIENVIPFYSPWDVRRLVKMKQDDRTNYFDSLLIVDEYDLNKTIKCKTTRGDVFTSSVQDILFNIINHSTYHRGQIATEFRRTGIEPLLTDYVFFNMKTIQSHYEIEHSCNKTLPTDEIIEQ